MLTSPPTEGSTPLEPTSVSSLGLYKERPKERRLKSIQPGELSRHLPRECCHCDTVLENTPPPTLPSAWYLAHVALLIRLGSWGWGWEKQCHVVGQWKPGRCPAGVQPAFAGFQSRRSKERQRTFCHTVLSSVNPCNRYEFTDEIKFFPLSLKPSLFCVLVTHLDKGPSSQGYGFFSGHVWM